MVSIYFANLIGQMNRTLNLANDLPVQVKLVVLSTGFSFGFGALFAKTWRVFKIFSNKTTIKTVRVSSSNQKLRESYLTERTKNERIID